jgi:hypothetical protein
MRKPTSTSIAKRAQAKAEADFATWLMMAKLGGFDDLSSDAQRWLEAYRSRLAQMGESEAVLATIRALYAAYYTEMGGAGEAPALAANVAPARDNVVALKEARAARAARPAASAPASKLPFPPLLIFAAMVALLTAIKLAFGS